MVINESDSPDSFGLLARNNYECVVSREMADNVDHDVLRLIPSSINMNMNKTMTPECREIDITDVCVMTYALPLDIVSRTFF